MKLSIIILNHNTKKLLEQTIASIKTQFKHEIIVVDNASKDGSSEYIKRKFPQIKLIQSKKNLGFAAGNNLGLKQSKGKYILLLNSDTKVVKNSLDDLVKFLDNHPKAGVVTPKLMLPDGAIDLSCHRGFPTIANSLQYFLGLESLFSNFKPFAGYHQTWRNFTQTHQVDAVSGAAMLFRRQIVEDIGLLDERFFMYAEDIDFCLRAKQKGWLVFYYPRAVVVHFKGSSGTKSQDKKLKTDTRDHFYQTMKQYFEKHSKTPRFLRPIINLGIDIIAKIRS